MDKFDCPICLDSYPLSEGCILCSPFDNQGDPRNIHTICIDCIKGFAKSAVGDHRVAKGGIGLPCPVPECQNVLLIGTFLL